MVDDPLVEKIDFEAVSGKLENSVEMKPNNLYTAVVVVCARMEIEPPTSGEFREKVSDDGRSYPIYHPVTGFLLLTVIWTPEKGMMIRAAKPAETITLDFTVEPQERSR